MLHGVTTVAIVSSHGYSTAEQALAGVGNYLHAVFAAPSGTAHFYLHDRPDWTSTLLVTYVGRAYRRGAGWRFHVERQCRVVHRQHAPADADPMIYRSGFQ